MDNNFILDLSIVGAHAKHNGGWIRQRDVRSAAETMWTLGNIQQDLALHNTQILRRLEALYFTNHMERKDGPEYQLVSRGCLTLLQTCRKAVHRNPDFQMFLLTHYFFSSYRDHLFKILSVDGKIERDELKEILNSRRLIDDRIVYLTELESLWEKRVQEGDGLIQEDRAKKLWQPSLDWVRHQQRIISQF